MADESTLKLMQMQARQSAFQAANQRAKPDAPIHDILTDAREIMDFLNGKDEPVTASTGSALGSGQGA